MTYDVTHDGAAAESGPTAGRSVVVLGIETSCDDTAAAVVRAVVGADGTIGPGTILSNVVFDQARLHAPHGGVVPEIAARAHLSRLDHACTDALDAAGMSPADVDAVAATAGPGLIGGLTVGRTMGESLALAVDKPFLGINHLEGHALTIRLTHGLPFPYLLLLVSGGHCQLICVDALGRYALLGTTRDDAVGESFDKAARLLGLGYPGGPAIERAAVDGNPDAVALPRPLTGRRGCGDDCDFSFSGLKTALLRETQRRPTTDARRRADLAAGFQAAAVDCLADRTANAVSLFAARYGRERTPNLVIAGGVAANTALRARLRTLADAHDVRLHVAPAHLCTDNAAMIAWAGAERLLNGAASDPDAPMPARARWPLAAVRPPRPTAAAGGRLGRTASRPAGMRQRTP